MLAVPCQHAPHSWSLHILWCVATRTYPAEDIAANEERKQGQATLYKLYLDFAFAADDWKKVLYYAEHLVGVLRSVHDPDGPLPQPKTPRAIPRSASPRVIEVD